MKMVSKKVAIASWAVLIAIALATCGESESDKKMKAVAFDALPFDQKIKSLSSSITEVSEPSKGEILMITYNKPAIWDGNNWAWNFFGTAKAVLSKVNALDPAVRYQQVAFMVRYPSRDSLGNEGSSLGMKVIYKMADFEGAKWENMYESDLANLASDVQFRNEGLLMSGEYCQKSSSKPPVFCKRVLNALVRANSRN